MNRDTIKVDPLAPPLTETETKVAVNNLVEHVQLTRSARDPPIPGQTFTNISYHLFEQPKVLKTGKKLYGFLKVRGCWPDEHLATMKAADIIKNVDSKFKIKIGEVGTFIPISDDDRYNKDELDVKTTSATEEIALRDSVVKEKDAERQRIMREIRERENYERDS
jgi:hypothetical protein